MIIVTALFTIKSGKEAQFETLARSMVEQVRAEPGALEYTLHKDAQNPGVFSFYERYADQAACDAHMATPYLARFLSESAALAEQEPQVHVLREVDRIPVKDADKRA